MKNSKIFHRPGSARQPEATQKCSEFSPEFLEDFLYFVSRETEMTENSPKPLSFFTAESPGKSEDKIHKVFWRAGKVNFSLQNSSAAVRNVQFIVCVPLLLSHDPLAVDPIDNEIH